MTSSRRLAPLLILSAAAVALAGVAQAAGGPDPVALVRKATDAFNRGDMKAASASYADDVAITDEFAPYQWHGPGTLQTYLNDFGNWSKTSGQTDQKVTISSVLRSDVSGDAAYVVMREVYTYKDHGRRMVELGDQAYTLHNGADGWKITGAAWAGSKPHRATAAKPATSAATPATAPAAKH
jgi:ketosteroid isomerase-like protein